MSPSAAPRRFVGLPTASVLGVSVPVASTRRSRLLGLAMLRPDRAGPGLLLPRCRSVHTFGMRFSLDVVFLDADGCELRRVRVGRARFVRERSAAALLEMPVAIDAEDRNGRGRGRGWRLRA